MANPLYLLTPTGIRLQESDLVREPLRHPLTLLYDRVEDTVLKHGEKPDVEDYFRRLAEGLRGTTLPSDLATLEIPLDRLTFPVLVLVNQAIAEPGNLAELVRRFGSGEAGAAGTG